MSDGRQLYVASEAGNVYVIPATDKCSVTPINHFGETCMASPAISEGALLFRTRNKLISVGSKN